MTKRNKARDAPPSAVLFRGYEYVLLADAEKVPNSITAGESQPAALAVRERPYAVVETVDHKSSTAKKKKKKKSRVGVSPKWIVLAIGWLVALASGIMPSVITALGNAPSQTQVCLTETKQLLELQREFPDVILDLEYRDDNQCNLPEIYKQSQNTKQSSGTRTP